ncbi:MAG: acyltransferase family protein [Acidimicrobiales bacterium]
MIAPVGDRWQTGARPRVYFPAVEGLRAVAAGLVFVHHLGFFSGATFSSSLGGLLDTFDVGVPVFFALSGFLLFRPHVEAILDDNNLPAPLRFWWRRAWRIYPAYWVVLTLVYVVLRPEVSTEAPVREYWIHFLLLQIYPSDGVFWGISQAWTLAVEVSFYAVLPLLAIGAKRWVAGRPVSQRAVLLLIGCGALMLLSVAWRMLAMRQGWSFNTTLWLPGTIDYFAIGMALAVAHAWSERRPVAAPLRAALTASGWWWWLAALAVLVFVGYQLGLPRDAEGRGPWHIELYRQFGYGLVAFLMVVPAIFSPATSSLHRTLRLRPLVFMGVISYSFYLWHTAVIEEWFQITDRTPIFGWGMGEMTFPSVAFFAMILFTFAGTVVLSWITYRLVERPALAWSRERGPGSSKAAS